MKINVIGVYACTALSLLSACSKSKIVEVAPKIEKVTVVTNLPVPVQDQKTKLFYFVNNAGERLSKNRYISASSFKPVKIFSGKNDSAIRIDTLALVQIEVQKKRRNKKSVTKWVLVDTYEDIAPVCVK